MAKRIRYGDFLHHVGLGHRTLSYNDLTPKPRYDPAGHLVPWRPPAIRLRPMEAANLLQPYVGPRFREQLQAVVPLGLYLALFQILILRSEVADGAMIGAGLVAVIVGLMLFMEGVKVGLMPFGEEIGDKLPSKVRLPTVLTVAFLLGVGVTLAEPAIGALQAAGAIVDPRRAPYLYALLNDWAGALVLVVGAGVGLAAVLGTLRFIHGWSLKPLIYGSLAPLLLLSLWFLNEPQLTPVLGLAWDSGAVTTGPVTVPLVLSLGIGVAAAGGRGDGASGFGIVTLASLFPILGVLLLALLVAAGSDPAEIVAGAAGRAAEAPQWYELTPWAETIGGLRAIVPLVLFLLVVMRWVLRERLREAGILSYGIALAVLGMIVFNLGLSYGLARLGAQAGGLVPAAFAPLEGVPGAPLYGFALGVAIALLFAWVLGLGATLAEPALNALGLTVENLTQGAFRKSTLMWAVAVGVGCGIALGVAKILFGLPLAWLLLPGYGFALLLTWLSSEEYVNIAWDSAGVTTGPVTVPLVLAMGLGFGEAVDAVEGFGILSMASIGPILAVLLTGLWVQWRVRRSHVESEQTMAAELAEVRA